jgi:hypothetical protein
MIPSSPKPQPPRVLIGCEFSAVVRDAFRRRGYDAWSCDLLETEGDSRWHLRCDLLTILDRDWDLIIAHPECRYLNHAGVRWLYEGGKRRNPDGSENPRDVERWAAMERAAEFFNRVGDAPCPLIARENSGMHPYAAALVGRKADQVIQPWMFGHGEVKATHLWLKGLPPLVPTSIVAGRQPRVHHESPGADRWKRRSRTLQGIADITETRVGQTSRMHWPVDAETTAKLNRVIRLDASAPLPWWRRVLRRLKGVE